MRRLQVDVDQFVHRLLQDCLAQATATWWEKRAEDFERARPQPGEFHGEASPLGLVERDHHLAAVAKACRARAALARQQRDAQEVDQALGEAM